LVLPAVLGEVSASSPAARAGLRAGDRIIAINETAVADWTDVPALIQRGAVNQGELRFTIDRAGERQRLRVQPESVVGDDGGTQFKVGIGVKREVYDYDALLRYGPLDAIAASGREAWTMTSATLGMLWRMVVGRASLENLSGPISISQYANASARSGLGHFLWFLGVISLSLCIINLLPIPILDGGHLLYYLIELVKGSPLSERAM